MEGSCEIFMVEVEGWGTNNELGETEREAWCMLLRRTAGGAQPVVANVQPS